MESNCGINQNNHQFEIHDDDHLERPPRHFYIRQEPDGTILTTVQTKYSRELPKRIYSRNDGNTRKRFYVEYGFDQNTLNLKYCIEPSGVLRIIQIVSLKLFLK